MQPHTTTTPNGAPPPAHDPAPAAARAPNTSITRPPCHEAAPQHVNTHDDPMALDIDSLLALELQHTEDTEHHMDLTPPELEPAARTAVPPTNVILRAAVVFVWSSCAAVRRTATAVNWLPA